MKRVVCGLLIGLACSSAFATVLPYATQTISGSYGKDWITNSQPHGSSGYQLAYSIAPNNWAWFNNSVQLALAANYSHWKTSTTATNQTVNVVGVAPVLDWYFMSMQSCAPFITASVGGAYLSNNNFGGRLLGSRLLFQDSLGIGANFGPKEAITASLNVLHYSNAGLNHNNEGLTVPVVLSLGYRF